MQPTHLCLLGDATSPHVQRWAREMRQRGYRVSLVTARPAPVDGVEVRTLRPVRRSADWLLRAREARRHVAELAPDIVHAHYITSYGYLAARCGRRPLVMTAWGTDLLVTPRKSPWMRWLTGWTLRQADLITGDSASLVAAAAAFRPRRPAQEIHWGVELQRFQPVPWEDKPGHQLVSARAWEPNYRIDTIVEAFALLRARQPQAGLALHLLGGGSLEARLRQQVQQAGLEGAVHFHGRLDDAGMARVLGAAKIAITVPESDATSVAMLESMACGLAVVASDLPANRQWLAPQCLVPAGDARALSEQLGALVEDDALAQARGRQNTERIARDGDRAVQMDRMHTLYQQLLRAR
ncbi:glycosyltransferase [Acidovorax sp. M2(2025)]|uniref:glycosyltransferase n=1 Tax=Acidovorax sp. M2(2025) TaxID=3411355 RepID=UPI003BF49010